MARDTGVVPELGEVGDLDRRLSSHYADHFSPDRLRELSQRFRREGIVIVPDIVPAEVTDAVRREAQRLLSVHAERRDLQLSTTDHTPRRMSVVQSEEIAAGSELITGIYALSALIDCLQTIAGEALHPCPAKDEEFLITRHEQPGDTHGWHWGDFSFALIWILECPPIEAGGLLQCVPHTDWDKSRPRVHEYLIDNPIRTYGFRPGDIYFLRTDTTLHGTVPLNRPCTRTILNMTWASGKDVSKRLEGNDRWWTEVAPTAALASNA